MKFVFSFEELYLEILITSFPLDPIFLIQSTNKNIFPKALKFKEEKKRLDARKNPFKNYICQSQQKHLDPTIPLADLMSTKQAYDLKCWLKCSANNMHVDEQKQIARIFTAIVSFVCGLSVLITAIRLIVHKHRLIFTNSLFMSLSVCYLFYSALTFIGIMLGAEAMTCQTININAKAALVKLGNVYESDLCSTSLLLGYLFDTAALYLWLLLALWWSVIIQFDIDSDCFKHLAFLCLIVMLMPLIQTGR